MKNTHTRVLAHPIEAVRPWIARAWSGTSEDVFPRDVVPTWRQNPAGVSCTDLVVGVTRLGHGPFSFTLREWDGVRWRVELAKGAGWHGFTLEALGPRQTRITHTLEVDMGLASRLVVIPMHDWAVESLLDRLEIALATGSVPARSERPMSFATRALFGLVRTPQKRARPAVVAA